jgi:hypothetical protein
MIKAFPLVTGMSKGDMSALRKKTQTTKNCYTQAKKETAKKPA